MGETDLERRDSKWNTTHTLWDDKKGKDDTAGLKSEEEVFNESQKNLGGGIFLKEKNTEKDRLEHR
jgi:hypothetical protein